MGKINFVGSFICPACKREIPLSSGCFEGCCSDCNNEGYWVDPAGILHEGEDEPWRMYE